MSSERQPIMVKSIEESWYAPGYRDPEVIFNTDAGDFVFRLRPEAFVGLHDYLCDLQKVIDNSGDEALDHEQFPWRTRFVASYRKEVAK